MTRKTCQNEQSRIPTTKPTGSSKVGDGGRAPPSPAMSSAGVLGPTVTRAERKQIRQLLRRALSGPIELAAERDPARDQPAEDLLARLVSEGLLTPSVEGYTATAETAAWLRRDLCNLPDEAHAGQHRAIEVETLVTPEGRQPVRRNLQESPLFPLLRLKEKDGRPFLSKEALAAGERLAADFDFAGLQPRITASWQPRLSARAKGAAPPAVELADNRIAARSRINRAVDAMGPELSGVALDICCFGKGLETVERERQWPARSAKLMLRAALLALARHYAPPPATARPRHWGDDDFRPRIG